MINDTNQDLFIIDYDPFVTESRIIIVEDGQRKFAGVSSNINELAKELPTYCDKFNQYNVKFHAPVGTFYELKRQLEEVEKSTYGENRINLEVC